MEAHVICCNDSVEYVFVGTKEAAHKKVEEVMQQFNKRFTDNTGNSKSVQYWHIHTVPCAVVGGLGLLDGNERFIYLAHRKGVKAELKCEVIDIDHEGNYQVRIINGGWTGTFNPVLNTLKVHRTGEVHEAFVVPNGHIEGY